MRTGSRAKGEVRMLEAIGRKLASYLARPRPGIIQVATNSPQELQQSLHPGDVLLVEGSSTFSTAVKYLTQSSWSHAALFVGNTLAPVENSLEQPVLIEADVTEGVRAVGLSVHASFHTRICRPVGLQPDEIERVIAYVVQRLGHSYDLRNIFDLARYFLPTPPVPSRLRRRLLALGSGDPTLAICSSLIAQAFQSVKYPILPETVVQQSDDPSCQKCHKEMLHIRHHSLFTPRDFDVSPYFQIIKPTLEHGFDPHACPWVE